MRLERLDITRLAQHLVYFTQVHFFFSNHLARVFFEKNRAIAHQFKQPFVKRQACLLGFERFQQDIIDAMLLRFQERANLE